MKREDLFALHDQTCKTAKDILVAKNQDYAAKDSLDNLTCCEQMGICKAEQGVIIRMTDKLSRVATVISNGKAAVASETLIDTFIDIINYSVLAIALLDRRYKLEAQKESDEKNKLSFSSDATRDKSQPWQRRTNGSVKESPGEID